MSVDRMLRTFVTKTSIRSKNRISAKITLRRRSEVNIVQEGERGRRSATVGTRNKELKSRGACALRATVVFLLVSRAPLTAVRRGPKTPAFAGLRVALATVTQTLDSNLYTTRTY